MAALKPWRALLGAMLIWLWPTSASATQATEIREARILVEPYADGQGLPDATHPGWQTLDLAKRLPNPSNELQRVWVKLGFHADHPGGEPWSVMFPRLPSGGKIFLNGILIDEVEGSSPTAQALWLSPHEFPISISALLPGHNDLVVAFASRDPRIAIGPPMVGPRAVVEPIFQKRQFLESTVPLLSIWLLLPVSLALLVIWIRRRQELIYGIAGLAALAWCLRTVGFIWTVWPIQLWIPWRALYAAGTGFSIVLLCMSVLRTGGYLNPRIERHMLAFTALGPLAVLLTGHDFARGEALWYAGIMLFNLFTLIVVARLAWQRRTWAAIALVLPPLMMFAAFVRYFGIGAGWISFSSLYWAHVVAPLVVLAMCLMLLVRFMDTLGRIENINLELERRVSAREAEIRANQASLLRMEREQASAEERQRLMRDMHDGLGSQLLSSLVMVERGAAGPAEIAQLLRDCIDDMRLVIDTLSPHDDDLLSALGSLRFRMAPRLSVAGITLDWKIAGPADMVVVEPGEGLGILRIVQEAITNALKHAHCTRLSVAIDASNGRLEVRIADNGKGFAGDPLAAKPSGRGMSNMKKRADAMGAELTLTSSSAGTEIVLTKSLLTPLSIA